MILAVLSAAFAVVMSASVAAAAVTRLPSGVTFGPEGTREGAFAAVHGISIDPANGDVYVLDEAEGGEIHKFGPQGKPLNFTSLGSNVITNVPSYSGALNELAVAPPSSRSGTAGDIYSASYFAGVSVFTKAGAAAGSFGSQKSCGVATDSVGNVFVAEYLAENSEGGEGRIVEYAPTGDPRDPVTEVGRTAPLKAICSLAADGSGDLFGDRADESGIARFSGLTNLSPQAIEPGGAAIASDPANEDLSVRRGGSVVIYDSAGDEVGAFGDGQLYGDPPLGVSGISHQAYVEEGSTGRIEIFGPLTVEPDVTTGEAVAVTKVDATLTGSVNPDGTRITECVFEYGPSRAYGHELPCRPDPADIGGGDQPVSVEAPVEGLEPFHSYHYRLRAKNSVTPTVFGLDSSFITLGSSKVSFGPCPANESLRVGPGSFLPDCRAYEQASPMDKNGEGVAGLSPLESASEDGASVTWYSPAFSPPLADRGGTQEYSTYLSNHDPAGGPWTSQRLLPPEEKGEYASFLGSTPDLRYSYESAGPAGRLALFETETGDGALTQITPYLVTPKAGAFFFGWDGTSADGSKVFFESSLSVPTTTGPDGATGHVNLYVWERQTGSISLAGVLPGSVSSPAPAGDFAGAYEWYASSAPGIGGTLKEGSSGGNLPITVEATHAVSSSGDQVYFTAAETGQLYLRRGLGGADPTTDHVSGPNAGVSDPVGEAFGPYPAAFQEATPDGSRAFFLSSEKLTGDAGTGEEDEGTDLYRYEPDAARGDRLVDITPANGEYNGARVQGLVGISSDGSSGYLVARGSLGTDPGSEPGSENLYRFAEFGPGRFHYSFVTTLAQGESQSPDRRNVSPLQSVYYPVSKTARVSEDGSTLLFTSIEPVTGYDNFDPTGGCGKYEKDPGPCPEIYLYTSQTGKVRCISCDPSGAEPTGAPTLQNQEFGALFTPTLTPDASLSRNLAADGSRIFFETPDALVPADVNGVGSCPQLDSNPGLTQCEDVYEWEAVGTGSCVSETVEGGCLYLLSTGQSDQPSAFFGASKDGGSVFIATASQLVPDDRDQLQDVYDVRVDGGLPSQFGTPGAPCTSTSGCGGEPVTTPPATAAGTTSISESGNVRPRQCRKRQVRRGERCQRRPPRRRHRRHRRKASRRSHGSQSGRATGQSVDGGGR